MSKSATILEEFGVRDVGDREVGIEIEMEGQNIVLVPPDGWNVTADGSLRGAHQAVEYVLSRPVKREDVKRMLESLQSQLTKAKAVIEDSERAGVHVHVNCQQMTTNEVINFGLMYLMFEDMMLKFCGESREGNLFCLSAKDAEYIVASLINSRQRMSLRNMQSNNYRYASVNFSSLSKYGSLEFRAMRTPADFRLISMWTHLLLCIKDAAKNYEDPRDIVEQVSAGSVEYFVQQVFGELAGMIYTPAMEEAVMESVRLIQAVAYTKPNPILNKNRKKPSKELVEGMAAVRAEEQVVFGGDGFGRPQPRQVVVPRPGPRFFDDEEVDLD